MLLKRIVVLSLLLTISALLTSTNTWGSMNNADALRLAKAWSESSGDSVGFNSLKVEANGNFQALISGAFLRFQVGRGGLKVSGLISYEEERFKVAPEPWAELTAAGQREQSTMGEGHFDLVDEKLFRFDPPVLLLTKEFSADRMDENQFCREVRWLLEWATYWSTRRFDEVFSGKTEDELKKESVEINEWMKKNRKRPW